MKRLLALSLIALAACTTSTPGTTASTAHRIEYRVIGTGTAGVITYETATGDSAQQANKALPWSFEMTDIEEGSFLYVSAQNGTGSGTISCAILVDGITVESNDSSGQFTICTASGTL